MGKRIVGRRVLALIRHGEYAQPEGVPSAHLPYGLTLKGQGQARDAAARVLEFARLQGLQLEPEIDCSSLRRAWETARLLGGALQDGNGLAFECREFDQLAERSLGALANLSVAAIEAILRDDPRHAAPPPGWKRDTDYRLPHQGCESLAQAGKRVARHLRSRAAELGANGSSRLKLVVGHGGAFRHAAAELGVLSRTDVARLSMDYCIPIYLEALPLEALPLEAPSLEALDGAATDASERFVHIAGDWRPHHETQPVD